MAEAPSFSFGAHYEIIVTGYRGVALSIPALGLGQSMPTKNLLAIGEDYTDGKYTLKQHLAYLHELGKLDPGLPLLVFGARNLCVNWRSPAVLNGKVHAADGEVPTRSSRPYYGIGLRSNRMACDVLLGGGSEPDSWGFFCAGVPVLWDGWEDVRLLDLMLCEASDHSHLFNLPRGNHPLATDVTRSAWQALQTVFIDQLYAPEATAAAALRATVEGFKPALRRCDDYFHSIMGVRDDGALVCLFAQGRLEDLGQIMKRRGCRRAVCLENSGSIMPTFFPQGIEDEGIALVRAPNFRPCGRAVIAVVLENAGFSSQPLSYG